MLSLLLSDDDSWDLVTCFCMKPFAGRAMIECNKCNTWIHLSCAKIRKSNVPETYLCPSCREIHGTPDIRRSHRSRVAPSKHLLDWPCRSILWTLAPLHLLDWPFLKIRSVSIFMVSQDHIEILFLYRDFGGPVPSSHPRLKTSSHSAILDLLRFVPASLQTLCVRQSMKWKSVCRCRAANHYSWDLGVSWTLESWTATRIITLTTATHYGACWGFWEIKFALFSLLQLKKNYKKNHNKNTNTEKIENIWQKKQKILTWSLVDASIVVTQLPVENDKRQALC